MIKSAPVCKLCPDSRAKIIYDKIKLRSAAPVWEVLQFANAPVCELLLYLHVKVALEFLGNISLTKTFVVLNMITQICNSCQLESCIHSLAYYQSICYLTVETVHLFVIQNTSCFIVDSSTRE